MPCQQYVWGFFSSSYTRVELNIIFCFQSIGQTGKVLSVDADGNVKIAVSGGTWTFNPLCLQPVNKDPSTRGSTLSGKT